MKSVQCDVKMVYHREYIADVPLNQTALVVLKRAHLQDSDACGLNPAWRKSVKGQTASITVYS